MRKSSFVFARVEPHNAQLPCACLQQQQQKRGTEIERSEIMEALCVNISGSEGPK